MDRVIKIFIGSSINEFKEERMEIENFIFRISRSFEKSYNVSVEPLLCEGFDDAYTKIRKQEEYNEKVRDSDFCFFLFFTRAGEFTREEFEVAREKFEESGRPKIYTYFKELGDEKGEDSLYAFMEELDKVFGHYYGTFGHIDTIKLRILLALKLQEMDFLEVKVEGDKCAVDGKPVLSLENVSEFANNQLFRELKGELEEVEVKYFSLKAKYEKGECSALEEREYIEIATRRQNLIDALEELRKNIFNMSLRMCQDEIRGEITLRQREAYRLFEAGDLEGANNILDFAEIKNEYQRRKAIREAEQKRDAQVFIREGRTKIDILTAMVKRKSRFKEIEEIYDEITEVAFEEEVEFGTIIDFVWFLYEQNKHIKACDIALKTEKTAFCNEESEKTAVVCFALGTVCSGLASKNSEAKRYYSKAIEIYEKLIRVKPESFVSNLATSYNNMGLFCVEHGQAGQAEEYYSKAIKIYEKLAKLNSERVNPDLAMSYNNMGLFCADFGKPYQAEYYYNKAIELYEDLVRDSDRYKPELAGCYNNMGRFYVGQGKEKKAEDYYNKAIAIRKELAESNPKRFNSDLAESYNSIGIFYAAVKNWLEKAEDYFGKSLAIRKKLAELNLDKFEYEFASSCINMGAFYVNYDLPSKAEEYYCTAIKIFEKLAKLNPERFTPFLALGYSNTGSFYAKTEQKEKAERYYYKAIKIYENLVKLNSERFNHELAISYSGIGELYAGCGKTTKAKEYYYKAILIREKLAQSNPERFNPALSVSYFNYGALLKDPEYLFRSFETALCCPKHPDCKQIISMFTK